MRFTLINDVFQNDPMIIDLFKSVFGNQITIKELDGYLAIYHNNDDLSIINEMCLSLSSTIMKNIVSYTSYNNDRIDDELSIGLSLIKSLSFGSYTLKSALLESKSITNKEEVLDYVLSSASINEEFVKSFAENDLNTSKVANDLYMHRNTVLYKLDKLKNATGFDLRIFKDAYILYYLVLNK